MSTEDRLAAHVRAAQHVVWTKGLCKKNQPEAGGWEMILAMSKPNSVAHQPNFFMKSLHIECET